MRPSIFLFTSAITSILTVTAQNQNQSNQTAEGLAAQIPQCVDVCDGPALAAVGCTETDFACHCAHSAELASIIMPCLQKNSTCTTDELTQFSLLAKEICVVINSTSSSNMTSNATITSGTPSSTATSISAPLATGAAPRALDVVGSFGLGAVVGLAVMIWAL